MLFKPPRRYSLQQPRQTVPQAIGNPAPFSSKEIPTLSPCVETPGIHLFAGTVYWVLIFLLSTWPNYQAPGLLFRVELFLLRRAAYSSGCRSSAGLAQVDEEDRRCHGKPPPWPSCPGCHSSAELHSPLLKQNFLGAQCLRSAEGNSPGSGGGRLEPDQWDHTTSVLRGACGRAELEIPMESSPSRPTRSKTCPRPQSPTTASMTDATVLSHAQFGSMVQSSSSGAGPKDMV